MKTFKTLRPISNLKRKVFISIFITSFLVFLAFKLFYKNTFIQQSNDSKQQKPVYQLIVEANEREQKEKQKNNPNKKEQEENKKPLKPVGVHFAEFKTGPRRELIQDPELGEVIELTYADGRKLYEFPGEKYDISTGEFSSHDK